MRTTGYCYYRITTASLLLAAMLFGLSAWAQSDTAAWYSREEARRDSICRFGKKYEQPDRLAGYPVSIRTSDADKIRLIHEALPDCYNVEPDTADEAQNLRWFVYQYYFVHPVTLYNAKHDKYVHPRVNTLKYKLKDILIADVNGDGLADIIHNPGFYCGISTDFQTFDVFINQGNHTYKMLHHAGYITAFHLNADSTLKSIEAFVTPCCDDDICRFVEYVFDKVKNDFTETDNRIHDCQLKENKKGK